MLMDTTQLLQKHGYLTAFFGLLLEYLGLPIPGELILLFLGALVAKGDLRFGSLLATGLAAVLLGDHFWYLLGRRGGKRWLRGFCRATLGSARCMSRTEHFFQRYGPVSLLFAKFVPGVRGFAMPMAGMTGVGYRRFLLFDSTGSLLWLTGTMILGMLMVTQLGVTETLIASIGRMMFLILALSTLVLLALRWKKRLKYGPPMDDSTFARQ